MSSFQDAIKDSTKGVTLCLHVVPGSKGAVFPAGYNQWRKCIEIKVKSEAEQNKANNEVISIVAGFFHLSHDNVCLKSGQKSKEKKIVMQNIAYKTVCELLEESLHG